MPGASPLPRRETPSAADPDRPVPHTWTHTMDTLADMDVVALALIAIGAILGLFKGGVRILVGIGAFVASLILADRHGADLVRFAELPVLADIEWLQRLPAHDLAMVESVAGRALVFLAVLLAGVIVARVLRRAMHGTALNGYDRLVGALVGGARGGLVAAVLLVVALSIPSEREQGAWHALRSDLGDSHTRAYAVELVSVGHAFLPETVANWLSSVLTHESLPEVAALQSS